MGRNRKSNADAILQAKTAPTGFYSKSTYAASKRAEAESRALLRSVVREHGETFSAQAGIGSESRVTVGGLDLARTTVVKWESRGWVRIERGPHGAWTITVEDQE